MSIREQEAALVDEMRVTHPPIPEGLQERRAEDAGDLFLRVGSVGNLILYVIRGQTAYVVTEERQVIACVAQCACQASARRQRLEAERGSRDIRDWERYRDRELALARAHTLDQGAEAWRMWGEWQP